MQCVSGCGCDAGKRLCDALLPIGNWTVQIVRGSDHAKSSKVIPRRWVIGGTPA